LNKVFEALKTGCALAPEVALKQFYECVRKSGESIPKFAQTLQDLLAIALPGVEPSIQYTMLKARLSTCLSEDVKLHIAFNGNMSLDDLIAALDKASPGTSYAGSSMDLPANTLIKSESADVNYMKAQSNSNQRPAFSGKCHYCNYQGHRIADCLRRKRDSEAQQSNYGPSQPYNNQRRGGGQGTQGFNRNNHSNAGNVSGNMGPRYGVASVNNTQVQNESIMVPLANSTFCDDDTGSRNQQMVNAQHSFLAQQKSLLQQQQVLIQQQQQQQHILQQQHHNNSFAGIAPVEANNNFTTVADTQERDESFPFFAGSYSSEAIPATLGDSGDCLLRLETPFVLGGLSHTAVALVDGGSTHSFITPDSFSEDQKRYSDMVKPQLQRRLFVITSSTGRVKEFCYLLPLDLSLGGWQGKTSFVVSRMVNKHKMVLGRDFLKKRHVIVDHGNDTLKVEGVCVAINSILAVNEYALMEFSPADLDTLKDSDLVDDDDDEDDNVVNSNSDETSIKQSNGVAGKRVSFNMESVVPSAVAQDSCLLSHGDVFLAKDTNLVAIAQNMVCVYFFFVVAISCIVD
jgi:hypothetical protein